MADLAPASAYQREEEDNVNGSSPDSKLLSKWNKRRDEGLDDRRRYEPTWHVCASYLANRQWVAWAPGGRRGGMIVPDTSLGENRERHTENMITQYVQTVLGKLMVEDLMPNVVFRREDVESEQFGEHAQKALKYAWDVELRSSERIFRMLNALCAFGTSGLRCYFDKGRGPIIGEVPIVDGEPVYDMEQARQIIAEAHANDQYLEIQQVRAGRICWEALSPFNMIPPPGIEEEERFPWLIVERPWSTEAIKLRFGEVEGLREMDLLSVDQTGLRELPATDTSLVGAGASARTRLKGHSMVSTGYELPCPDYPTGMTTIWSNKTLLASQEGLPYELAEEPHHGVLTFKYHRVPGRYWGVGVVEPLIGPQRQRNRSRSQYIEMKDRAGLGRVYAHKGTITAQNKPTGKIAEVIEIPLGHQFPMETSGTGPGPWIENEVRMNDEAMDRIAGLREVSLGQAPGGVSAYSAMALLAEQDDRRMAQILRHIREQVAQAVELTLFDIRRYWPPEKQINLAGPGGMIEHFIFSSSQIPEMYLVEVPPGASRPRSQAAEIQKIFDIYDRSVASGRPLGMNWLKESLDQGKAMPIPEGVEETQYGKAQLENLLLSKGAVIQPDYYDDDMLHIQVHRQAQVEAAGSGQQQLVQALEYHIVLHSESGQMKQRALGSPGQVQAGGGSSVPQQQGPQGGQRIEETPGGGPAGNQAPQPGSRSRQ